MQIVLLNGGLANQAFQYMFGMRLQKALGETVIYDDSYFDSIEKARPHSNNANSQRRLLKKVFGIEVLELSSFFTKDDWDSMLKKCYQENISMIRLINSHRKFQMIAETGDHNFDGEIISFQNEGLIFENYLNKDIYWHGYWIGKDNFESLDSRDIFGFRKINEQHNIHYMASINQSYSVGIHVRRFSLEGFQWDLPLEWYSFAINEMKKNHTELLFHIFSDDIAWCKENIFNMGFSHEDNILFVEGNESENLNFRDMQLMKDCKHLIISNSSFSYLAALLNKRGGLKLNPTDRRL